MSVAGPGLRLFLNSKLIDTAKGRRITVSLLPGAHSLLLESRGAGPTYVGWSLEGGFGERPLPADALFHNPSQGVKTASP